MRGRRLILGLTCLITLIIDNPIGQTSEESSLFPNKRYIVGWTPHSIAIGDYDADGLIDLAVANQGTNDISLLRGLGGGSFAKDVRFSVGLDPKCVISGVVVQRV